LPSDMAGGRVTSFLGACSTDAEIVQHETSHWTRKVQNYTVVKKPDPYDIFSYFLCSLWNGAVRHRVISE